MFHTGVEDNLGSHSGKWEGIFQLGNFEQTGKVGEFQKNVICYFLVIFK